MLLVHTTTKLQVTIIIVMSEFWKTLPDRDGQTDRISGSLVDISARTETDPNFNLKSWVCILNIEFCKGNFYFFHPSVVRKVRFDQPEPLKDKDFWKEYTQCDVYQPESPAGNFVVLTCSVCIQPGRFNINHSIINTQTQSCWTT